MPATAEAAEEGVKAVAGVGGGESVGGGVGWCGSAFGAGGRPGGRPHGEWAARGVAIVWVLNFTQLLFT